MAIIGEIRKHYWLLVVIIGIALLLFILSDFQRKSNRHTSSVGVIAGEKISYNEFAKRVEENVENQKANTGKNVTSEESMQIRENTWQQVVNEIIFNKQYDKLGVSVPVEELDDLIRGKNPHPYIRQSFTDPKTGNFDPKAVTNFLQNLDQMEPAVKQRYLAIEKYIKTDRLNTKYINLIMKGFYVPTTLAKENYEQSSTIVATRMAQLPYQSISDSTVKLTDADYEKYYNDNKYKFKQEVDSRSIEYVVFQPEMSAEDIAQMKTSAEKLYTEFVAATDIPSFVNSVSDNRYDSTWHKKGDFSPKVDSLLFNAPVGQVMQPVEDGKYYRIFKIMDRQSMPDSLRASHILISYAGSQNAGATRTREQAEKMADSILNLAKGSAVAFEAIASTQNDDESVKAKKGDLGYFHDGAMVPTFNQAVQKGAVGSIVKVESPFGFHIVKITGKKDPSAKVKVASVDFIMEPGNKTIEKYYNDASSFSASYNKIDKFEKAVKEKNLNMRSYETVTADSYSLPGLKSAREIVRWAFNKDTKKGDVSNVFDIEGAYVVATLKNAVEKGYVPLTVVKEAIKPLVLRDKKAETLLTKVNDQLAKTKDLNALVQAVPGFRADSAEVSFASVNIPKFGPEPKVVGRVYASKQGQLSAPVQGEQGVYVFTIDQIKPAPAITDFANHKKQMSMMFSNQAQIIPTILQEKANVKDNRLLFF